MAADKKEMDQAKAGEKTVLQRFLWFSIFWYLVGFFTAFFGGEMVIDQKE